MSVRRRSPRKRTRVYPPISGPRGYCHLVSSRACRYSRYAGCGNGQELYYCLSAVDIMFGRSAYICFVDILLPPNSTKMVPSRTGMVRVQGHNDGPGLRRHFSTCFSGETSQSQPWARMNRSRLLKRRPGPWSSGTVAAEKFISRAGEFPAVWNLVQTQIELTTPGTWCAHELG